MRLFFLIASLCSLCSLIFALPVISPAQRDVWDPPVTYPTSDTVWVTGGTYNVTWSTANMPSQVTNPIGLVYLRRGNVTEDSPLVQGFPLTAGAVNVTIPEDTDPDSDWRIILMGDSGNWSQQFTIVHHHGHI